MDLDKYAPTYNTYLVSLGSFWADMACVCNRRDARWYTND